MTGFCRKTICLFIAMLFIFSLSIPAFAVSGRTTVYRTKTGDHYHTSDCRFLGKSKIKTTLDAAVNEYHLTPCSICNPPSFESEAEIAAEPVEPDLNKTTRPANGEVLYSKNKDATVDIPTGKLFLQIAYGSTWKNPTELFGKNTNYESGDGELDVGKGEDWTFTFG